jgi:hypothetical protein
LGAVLSLIGLSITIWSCEYGLRQQADIQNETDEEKLKGFNNLMIDLPSLPTKD